MWKSNSLFEQEKTLGKGGRKQTFIVAQPEPLHDDKRGKEIRIPLESTDEVHNLEHRGTL